MARNERFREVIIFETVWPGDLPWWCYALSYGRYVEERPLQWRNVSFWPPEWLQVILGWKGNETTRKRYGTCTLRHKNQSNVWPEDIPLVLFCIKLWSVHGGGTVRVTKCIILASVWARNSQFKRHLNGPKKATKHVPYSPKINENLAKCLV
jgi:hypothetical protein